MDTAVARSRRSPWRLSIAAYLTLGLGGLTFIAIVATLWLSLGVALRNTDELLDDKGRLLLGGLRTSVGHFLAPAETQVEVVASLVEGGDLDRGDRRRLLDILHAIVAATPQTHALVFLAADGTEIVAFRDGERVVREITPWTDSDLEAGAVAEARRRGDTEMYWGPPVHLPAVGTVVNLRRPVVTSGTFRGVIAATVTIRDLSRHLIELETETAQNAFILYDHDRVLAHRTLAGGFPGLSPERPLPAITEIGDPVLFTIWEAGWQERTLRAGSGHHARLGEEDYIFIYDQLDRYGDQPWLIGSYFPEELIGAPFIRLVQAALVGGGLLLVAVAAAVLLGRAVRRPIDRLAVAADAVGSLDLEQVPRLRRSRFRELDSAAAAFNAMVAALRAFALYVPRDLVARLLRSRGDVGALRSETREITIMFTDIVGFTGRTELLGAEATATFLNEHFDLLTACIEAEGGTVDKFLGDGIMALWNAVEAQPDHAARAVRAATRIAEAVRQANAGDAPTRLRVGIHTGPAVVGNIGSRSRMNYTVVGDPVNAAERLQSLGRHLLPEAEVAVLVSAATRSALGDAGEKPLHALGAHLLRGRDQSTEVFALHA